MKFCTFLYILLRYVTSRNNSRAATRKNTSDRVFLQKETSPKNTQFSFYFQPLKITITTNISPSVFISSTLAIGYKIISDKHFTNFIKNPLLSLYHPTFRFSHLHFFFSFSCINRQPQNILNDFNHNMWANFLLP